MFFFTAVKLKSLYLSFELWKNKNYCSNRKQKILSQILYIPATISMDTHFKSIKKRGIDYYLRNKIKKMLSNSKTELLTQEMDNWQYTL